MSPQKKLTKEDPNIGKDTTLQPRIQAEPRHLQREVTLIYKLIFNLETASKHKKSPYK